MFQLLSLNPIILVKSSATISRYDEESDFPEVVSLRDMAGMACHGINY
jgi:hypothetical protein